MRITLPWPDFRTQLASGLPYRYLSLSGSYLIYAIDGNFEFECRIPQDNNPDQAEFEANYKSASFATLSQVDSDGAQIVRNKAAKKGWTFCSMPIELKTSRLQIGNLDPADDMFCQDSTGVNRPFVSTKIYDSNNVEITEPGEAGINYADAVKTVLDFEPPYDYEIIGGEVRTLTTIERDLRMWLIAAPDVPAPNGSKEMGGGINLRYLSPGNVWAVDGRVTKFATYNQVFHTNKIRVILKYPVLTIESLQILIQFYKL